jgi:hypothetical protein
MVKSQLNILHNHRPPEALGPSYGLLKINIMLKLSTLKFHAAIAGDTVWGSTLFQHV